MSCMPAGIRMAKCCATKKLFLIFASHFIHRAYKSTDSLRRVSYVLEPSSSQLPSVVHCVYCIHLKILLPWPVWRSCLEHCPIDRKVMSLIPSQGTHLGCKYNPCSGCVQEGSQSMFFSFSFLSLPPSLPLSLKAMGKMSSGED